MAMELVATYEVGSGGAASIEFTGIPATGKDLLCVISHRRTLDNPYVLVGFNSSSSPTHAYRYLRAEVPTVTTGTSPFGSGFFGFFSNQSSFTANTFSNISIYMSNYTGSANKSFSVDAVAENNNTLAHLDIGAGSVSTTSPITTLSISSDLAQYSTASIYIIS